MSRPGPIGTGDIRPAGERALLVDLPDLGAVLGFHTRLTERQGGTEPVPGIVEVLPAARTVLVQFDPARIDAEVLAAELSGIDTSAQQRTDGSLVEIEVVYDGEDLAEVADHLGCSIEEVVDLHTAGPWTAAFAGFAPGFVYLGGGPAALDVPRRGTPRVRIPAGAVALAGPFAGIYPRQSPGGWQLIGSTNAVMWDETRESPALVRPGDRVQFVAVDSLPPREQTPSPRQPAADPERPGLRIRTPGLRTVVQDLGRPGLGELGVGTSGTLDRPALRLANELLGNAAGEAVLEIPWGGLVAEASGRVEVAITGARAPIRIRAADGGLREVDDQRGIALDAGDRIEIGAPTEGLRCLLAIRGGFDLPAVLGSRSHDSLAQLGPEPIAAGDLLARADRIGVVVAEPQPWPSRSVPVEPIRIGIRFGPRQDWFTEDSLRLLLDQTWTVTEDADRVGLRLSGERPLERSRPEELPSEPVVTGSLQVPPEGMPMVFLADHPATGGYPVIAVAAADDLATLGQLRPGDRLRFIDRSTDRWLPGPDERNET